MKINSYSKSKPIKKVTPTKVFLVKSCPCEEQAAHIRKASDEAIIKPDTSVVAYRFLQSRQAYFQTQFDAILWSITAPIGFLTPFSPNLRNSRRHKKTMRKCGAYLDKELSKEAYEKLKGLTYYRGMPPKLTKILTDNNIELSDEYNRLAQKFEQIL